MTTSTLDTGRVHPLPTPENRLIFDATAYQAVSVLALAGDPAARRVSDLGWTQEEAALTRSRLAAFEEDWDAPGMDAYDAPPTG